MLAIYLLYTCQMRRKSFSSTWFQVYSLHFFYFSGAHDLRFRFQVSNVFKALVGLRVIVANGIFGLVELVGYIARGKYHLITWFKVQEFKVQVSSYFMAIHALILEMTASNSRQWAYTFFTAMSTSPRISFIFSSQ